MNKIRQPFIHPNQNHGSQQVQTNKIQNETFQARKAYFSHFDGKASSSTPTNRPTPRFPDLAQKNCQISNRGNVRNRLIETSPKPPRPPPPSSKPKTNFEDAQEQKCLSSQASTRPYDTDNSNKAELPNNFGPNTHPAIGKFNKMAFLKPTFLSKPPPFGTPKQSDSLLTPNRFGDPSHITKPVSSPSAFDNKVKMNNLSSSFATSSPSFADSQNVTNNKCSTESAFNVCKNKSAQLAASKPIKNNFQMKTSSLLNKHDQSPLSPVLGAPQSNNHVNAAKSDNSSFSSLRAKFASHSPSSLCKIDSIPASSNPSFANDHKNVYSPSNLNNNFNKNQPQISPIETSHDNLQTKFVKKPFVQAPPPPDLSKKPVMNSSNSCHKDFENNTECSSQFIPQNECKFENDESAHFSDEKVTRVVPSTPSKITEANFPNGEGRRNTSQDFDKVTQPKENPTQFSTIEYIFAGIKPRSLPEPYSGSRFLSAVSSKENQPVEKCEEKRKISSSSLQSPFSTEKNATCVKESLKRKPSESEDYVPMHSPNLNRQPLNLKLPLGSPHEFVRSTDAKHSSKLDTKQNSSRLLTSKNFKTNLAFEDGTLLPPIPIYTELLNTNYFHVIKKSSTKKYLKGKPP